MTKGTREQAKRWIEQAIQNLEWSTFHLSRFVETYEPTHLELSNPASDVTLALKACQDALNKLYSAF